MYTSETEVVSTQLMTIDEHFNYAELSDLDATAVQMPYSNSGFSFLMVISNERTGLNALNLQKVNVTIPKFKAEFTINCNAALTNVCS